MRRLTLNTKLAIRKVKHQDVITKVGLSIVAGFILPTAIKMLIHILSGDATITFGSF